MDSFSNDIESAMKRLSVDLNAEEVEKMQRLRDKLFQLHGRNLVKINHSIMELLCAKHLVQNGFNVELEHTLDGVSCDIWGAKGYGTLIVEVETGFVPPEHALDPRLYLRARVSSKITRYSGYSNKFCLGTPPYYVMQIAPELIKPPRFRSQDEVNAIKRLCDMYYTNPPVTLEEIRNARIHSIFTLDVDNLLVRELDVNEYIGKTSMWAV